MFDLTENKSTNSQYRLKMETAKILMYLPLMFVFRTLHCRRCRCRHCWYINVVLVEVEFGLPFQCVICDVYV